MKLQEHDYGFEAVLPENRTPFKIKTSAKLFDILSSGIYKDKILAVIRELSCNAYDAHVVAKKKHVPFKLRLPTRMDPTFYVEDEGTGIDPDKITDIYWTYGESSKTDSNDQIGALGLGSKSPFAYTKSSFVVKNRYQGIEYTYLCFINEDGMPDGSRVSEEPTDAPSGVTVEFAVRPEDIDAFRVRTDRFFKRWAATMPIFVDQKADDVLTSKITKVIEGTDWYLERTDRYQYTDHQGAVAMQGNVPYPIEVGSIPKLPKELGIIASNPFIITFDMGEINFASSREALQYDERTCSNIIARLQEVRAELEQSFSEKIFKKGMTQLQFINNFRKTFREFTTTIKFDSGHNDNSDTFYVTMLLGKKLKTDTVTYDKINYHIEDLLSGVIDFNHNGHQSFGIFKASRRTTRSAKVFMKQYSMLKYKAMTDIDATLIHTTWNVGSVIDEGEVLEYEWKNAVIPKRAEPTPYFRILAIADKFSVTTRNRLVIEAEKITFFVNDVGSAGEARYRAFADRISGTAYFVTFDPKVSDVATVVSELEALIENGLKGATIEMVSAQPDYRAPIEREKIETGTMRVKYRDVIFTKRQMNTDVYDGVHVGVNDVEATVADEGIVKIADLQAQPIVLYVVKRRSPTQVFDDTQKHTESVIKDEKLMVLGAKYIFPELLVPFESTHARNKSYAQQQSLRVYVLNDGQIEWLRKRKVNVVGYRNMIATRLAEMEKKEQFLNATERVIGLKKVPLVSSMFDATESNKNLRADLTTVPANTSIFKETFSEYVTVKAGNAVLSEAFAKLRMHEIINGATSHGQAIAADLNDRLAKKYPMLKFVGQLRYLDKKDLAQIINYIESMDSI